MKCIRWYFLAQLGVCCCIISSLRGGLVEKRLNTEHAFPYLLPRIVRAILHDIAAGPVRLSAKQNAIVEYQIILSAIQQSGSNALHKLIACKETTASSTHDEFVRAMKECMRAKDNHVHNNSQVSSLANFYPLPLAMYVGGNGPLFSVTAESNPGIVSISRHVLSESDKAYINDIIESLLTSSCMHEIYTELYRLPCTTIRPAVVSLLLLYLRPDLVYRIYKPSFTPAYFQDEPF